MDLRKLLSPERLFSALCSKGRVFSGFGLGVLASLLVFSLMFSVGGNRGPPTVGSSSPSLLSWFFSVPGNGSSKEPPETWVPQREDGLAGGSPHESNSAMGTSSGSNPRGKAAGQEDGVLEILSGDRGNVSGKAGVEERSYANGTGASSYLDGTNAGKPSGSHTIESSVLKQGESSCDGEFAGLGNGSTSLKADSTEKSHEKSSSANLICTVSTGGGELTANLSTQDTNTSLPGVGGIEQKTDKTDSLDVGKDNIAGSREASESREAVDAYKGSSSIRMKSGLPAKCDIFNGRWVRDDNKPYYPPGSCPHIDRDFNCHDNGRPDYDFLRWRWRPNDCDIPSLNATDFLTRLRGQRLIFVGDSLNRNMWESLVCILRHGVRDKNRVYEMSGRREFKTRGYYSFIFKDYNCSVDFVRSPFLVRELYASGVNGSEDERLRLDVMDATTSAYHEADIVVFNTGHWWTHEKTSRGINYYQEGEHVYSVLKVMEAYKKALSTWARWLDKNINPSKTQVVFRGYSLTHFSGGQWNSGGQCHKETEPIFNQSYVRKYPAKMRALEQVLKQMKTPVMYLNISSLTDYRKDGHPSIYRKKYESVEEKINAEKSQDCSHWCLPGIPDTWNELLYASLLMVGRGSWRN